MGEIRYGVFEGTRCVVSKTDRGYAFVDSFFPLESFDDNARLSENMVRRRHLPAGSQKSIVWTDDIPDWLKILHRCFWGYPPLNGQPEYHFSESQRRALESVE